MMPLRSLTLGFTAFVLTLFDMYCAIIQLNKHAPCTKTVQAWRRGGLEGSESPSHRGQPAKSASKVLVGVVIGVGGDLQRVKCREEGSPMVP